MSTLYRFLTAFIIISVIVTSVAIAEEQQEDFLPIGFTEEEMTRLHEIGINHQITAPPVGKLRNCAEWERSEGVIIRWPLGITVSLVAALSETAVVWTIVSSDYYKNQAISSYTSGGVNMDSVDFIMAPTNSIWTRDYGPWFIFRDQTMEIVDHQYNRPRPLDDVIPQIIGSDWGMAVYGMDLKHTGGNHMSDGLGMSMSSRLVWDENTGKTHREIDSIMLAYLGNQYTVMEYVQSGGIHHIDCWAKFLNPTTILVEDMPTGDPSHVLLDARAQWLSEQMSPWGEPYTIVRVYCPYPSAYTNSLILNNKVFVPIINSPTYDNAALQVYADAMPGYEILGFSGSFYDDDAIHCRTMAVPDRHVLFIDHVPLHDIGDTGANRLVTVHIEACSGYDLIEDSLKIYYSVNGGPYTYAPLTAAIEPYSYTGYIPAQGPGSVVDYFIKAADLSGRVETHPFIGEPWAHSYAITGANQPPLLAEIGPREVMEGENLNFTISASDPDGTTPSLDAEDVPLNAVFEDNGNGTGSFDFSPDYDQAGDYNVRFIASDGSLADTELVTITVADYNFPPSIIEPDTLLCLALGQFGYYPEISDPDDTEHTITYSLYPGWMSVSNDSIVGQAPDYADTSSFRVNVSDGVSSDSADVSLVVYVCGDADGSGSPDIDDVVFLIAYIFSGGPAPNPLAQGDADCSGAIDIDDAVYLVTYIFSGGPVPCASCM
ncbi:MAG: agmatine deiminase family protein [candidate division Zixibacteria bacterium]|nr:agmatine deiminase family protein [candidate division Zixibacteria bacterium]MBU1470437.1 agmatine deiminase family protein [candidate division Zixibacteria bacterium]MBU2625886.1 agmatine deiminase family protein [candidate division Zixibacteria bacterium]